MLKRIVSAFLVVAAIVSIAGFTQAASVSAKDNQPNGNNGTLKIHEQGTPSGTEDNDPKVCVFNVEGFDFDANQSGYLKFSVQGGDGPTGVASGPHAFGPTNLLGYYATQYFNLENGHYKATLYGKDAGGNINLQDEKAKSKVFKVECAEVQPEGTSKYKLKCELLKLKAPKSIQPEDATYQYYLDGQSIALGSHALEAGEYTLTLKVNGVLVDTDTITIEACEGEEEQNPNATVSAVCDVDGQVVKLTFTNTGNAASNVTVNGTAYVVPANDSVVATVPITGAIVNVTVVIDGELVDGITVNCPTGGSGGNGETPTTPTTPVTVVVNGGAGEVVSLPVTSGASDKIASIVAMIAAVMATIGGYVVRMRYAAQL